jgi:Kef-type K+ transport system membrane component KefB
VPAFDSKLTAVAFGIFIPFFFVVSGMRLDVDALFASASGLLKTRALLRPVSVVRGTPAMLLYRGVLPMKEDRRALALFSATQLLLVVAITTVAHVNRRRARGRRGAVDARRPPPRAANAADRCAEAQPDATDASR